MGARHGHSGLQECRIIADDWRGEIPPHWQSRHVITAATPQPLLPDSPQTPCLGCSEWVSIMSFIYPSLSLSCFLFLTFLLTNKTFIHTMTDFLMVFYKIACLFFSVAFTGHFSTQILSLKPSKYPVILFKFINMKCLNMRNNNYIQSFDTL